MELEKQLCQKRQVDLNYELERKIRIVNHSEQLVKVVVDKELRAKWGVEIDKLKDLLKSSNPSNVANIHIVLASCLSREAMVQHGKFTNSHYAFAILSGSRRQMMV